MIRAAKTLNKINVYIIRNNINKCLLSTDNGSKPSVATTAPPKSFVNDKSSSSGSSDKKNGGGGSGGGGGGSRILFPLALYSVLSFTLLSIYSTKLMKDEKFRQFHDKSLGLSFLTPYLIQFGKSLPAFLQFDLNKVLTTNKTPAAIKPSSPTKEDSSSSSFTKEDSSNKVEVISTPSSAEEVVGHPAIQSESEKEEVQHKTKEVLEEVEKKIR